MATPIERLQAMRSLIENWDGYGAAAPAATSIDLAQKFVGPIEPMLKKHLELARASCQSNPQRRNSHRVGRFGNAARG